MRNICYAKDDWGTVKWRGATMHHPFQQDSSSCGVIVTMVMNTCVISISIPIYLTKSVGKTWFIWKSVNNNYLQKWNTEVSAKLVKQFKYCFYGQDKVTRTYPNWLIIHNTSFSNKDNCCSSEMVIDRMSIILTWFPCGTEKNVAQKQCFKDYKLHSVCWCRWRRQWWRHFLPCHSCPLGHPRRRWLMRGLSLHLPYSMVQVC